MLGTSLGLVAVLAFSVSNMMSGVVSRREGSIVTAVFGRFIGALVILPAMLVIPTTAVTMTDVALSLLAGLLVAGSLLLFFRAMRGGSLGATSALNATVCALVPVLVLLFIGVEVMTPTLAIGGGVALFSGVMISRTSSEKTDAKSVVTKTHRRAYLDAATGGVCYGLAVVLLGRTSPEAGLLPAFLLQVGAGLAVTLVAMVRRRRLRLWGGDLGRVAAAGACSSIGTAVLLVASKLHVLSIVSVMQSLSSVAVAALAWLFLKENLGLVQKLAIVGSVAGAALLAVS